MDSFTLILQFLLLVGMAIAWWSARRDLINIATRQQTPSLEKIEQVCATVEQLLDELDQKIAEIEARVAAVEIPPVAATAKTPITRSTKSQSRAADSRESKLPTVADPAPAATRSADSRYDEVYALSDSGLDPETIARRTGLGFTEVEMVLNLRPVEGD